MTFYDDAEFAAIRSAREAISEELTDEGRSAAIGAVVDDMRERHGQDGVTALVVALSRHLTSALHVIADTDAGETASDVLDRFERHKLEQIVDEEDWGDSGAD